MIMAFSDSKGRRDAPSLLPGSTPLASFTQGQVFLDTGQKRVFQLPTVSSLISSGKHLLIATYLATADTTETEGVTSLLLQSGRGLTLCYGSLDSTLAGRRSDTALLPAEDGSPWARWSPQTLWVYV